MKDAVQAGISEELSFNWSQNHQIWNAESRSFTQLKDAVQVAFFRDLYSY